MELDLIEKPLWLRTIGADSIVILSRSAAEAKNLQGTLRSGLQQEILRFAQDDKPVGAKPVCQLYELYLGSPLAESDHVRSGVYGEGETMISLALTGLQLAVNDIFGV